MTYLNCSNRVGVIIPAAGQGSRFGGPRPKQLSLLAGWPVLAHVLNRFEPLEEVAKVVVAAPPGREEEIRRTAIEPFGFEKDCLVVAGGASRQESVYQAFLALEKTAVDIILVHDAVRPLTPPALISRIISQADALGAAIAAIPVKDTLKLVKDGVIHETLKRDLIWQAQTPQGFKREILARALAEARRNNFLGTDEASLVEKLGYPVHIVTGPGGNIKITWAEDLILAETLIKSDFL